MKRIFFILYFLSATAIITMAQEMNLNQCIRYALENNLTYANKNIEASIAHEQHLQSKRDFLPSLSAGSSAINDDTVVLSDPTTTTIYKSRFFSMNFSLRFKLRVFWFPSRTILNLKVTIFKVAKTPNNRRWKLFLP